MKMFRTSAEIRQCGEKLIASLHDLKDARGPGWTSENFDRLEKFATGWDPDLKSHYRKRGENAEFLWDFMASSPETGIFLAAESEQAVHTAANVTALKHDFGKLLYVYSPIRMLITKAKNHQHAEELAGELALYAEGCSLNFNPGASFILHFGLYNDAGNVTYHWQSKGEPNTLPPEKIAFELVG